MLLLAACGSVAPPHPSSATEQKPEVGKSRIQVVERIVTQRMIRYSPPVYPKEARKAHVQGEVALDIVIAKTGEVGEIHLVSGHPMLVAAAVEAVKSWRYTPTSLNGEVVTRCARRQPTSEDFQGLQ
jgi:protein TonB